MFSDMLEQLREKTTFLTCRAQIQTNDAENVTVNAPRNHNVREIHETPVSALSGAAPESHAEEERQVPFQYARQEMDPNNPATWGKVARNDLCPCGSGKKYKHCHGKF